MKTFRIIVALATLAWTNPVLAQTANGRATTAAPSYSNNIAAPLSLDLSGNLRVNCVTGCGGGGGSTDVNLTGLNGTAPSTSNPLFTAPGTGQTWPVSGTFWQATQPVSGTFWQATQPVSGTFWQATQPVSIAATVTTSDTATGATAAAVPARAMAAGARSGANLVGIIQSDTTAKLDVATATTTQLVALSGSTKIYVGSFSIIAGGTGNIKFVYGTGSNCGTGTTDLTANYPLTAQAGIALGSGLGPVLIVPASQALCVTTSAAVQMSGHVSYTQF